MLDTLIPKTIHFITKVRDFRTSAKTDLSHTLSMQNDKLSNNLLKEEYKSLIKYLVLVYKQFKSSINKQHSEYKKLVGKYKNTKQYNDVRNVNSRFLKDSFTEIKEDFLAMCTKIELLSNGLPEKYKIRILNSIQHKIDQLDKQIEKILNSL